jgi:ATP-dependent DNA helicase RecG
LNVLCRTRDGFEIADEDLKLRGPGDFLGQRQHGLPELKIADLASDLEILRRSGKAAQEILKGDPQLELSQHAALKNEIEALFRSVGDI